jgi:hypothetical protein
VLRHAANQAGCEAILALADIKTDAEEPARPRTSRLPGRGRGSATGCSPPAPPSSLIAFHHWSCPYSPGSDLSVPGRDVRHRAMISAIVLRKCSRSCADRDETRRPSSAAIDTVWLSFGFRNKPVAAVGYSGSIGAGIRAIEHLAHVLIEAEAVPLRNTVVIPFVRTAFAKGGEPVNPETEIRLQVLLEDLAWWSSALEKARADGELTPGTLRARAALAAVQS